MEVLPVKVLHVEDDLEFREVLGHFFTEKCEKALAAKNGREALDLLLVERPDVVITDINMPEMDGLTLIERMRERGIFLPTIILSGSVDKETRKRAAGLGVVDCIVKPCSLAELVGSITATMVREQDE